ncbi:MAG: hypothetical protein ABSC23_01515 [Bryobacteraceae bacterium]|jgi:hypothetical protein
MDVKQICRYLPLLALALVSIQPGKAQSTVDVNMGFGSAQDKANTGLDATSANFAECTASTTVCAKTPSLSGFMLGFGANAILWKKFGIGGEANFQTGKQSYADLSATQGFLLKSRVTFYDFDGIYQPVNQPKTTVQILGGVGGVNTKFYEGLASGSLLGNSANGNYAISSSNHFQVHGGVGVQLYVSGNFFIRPQFDIHYVPNFIQFGSNLVTSESVWVGYTLGDRQ